MRTKLKISVSMDEELLKLITAIVEEGSFRSTSHFVEYAAQQLIRGRHHD